MYVKFRSTEILDNLAKYLWRKIAHKRAVEYVKLCKGFWQTGLGITQGFVIPSHCSAEPLLKSVKSVKMVVKLTRTKGWTNEKVPFTYPETKPIEGTSVVALCDPVLEWKEIKRMVWRKILTIKFDKKQRTWLVNQKALNEKAFLQVFGRKVLKRVEKYEHVRFC